MLLSKVETLKKCDGAAVFYKRYYGIIRFLQTLKSD